MAQRTLTKFYVTRETRWWQFWRHKWVVWSRGYMNTDDFLGEPHVVRAIYFGRKGKDRAYQFALKAQKEWEDARRGSYPASD